MIRLSYAELDRRLRSLEDVVQSAGIDPAAVHEVAPPSNGPHPHPTGLSSPTRIPPSCAVRYFTPHVRHPDDQCLRDARHRRGLQWPRELRRPSGLEQRPQAWPGQLKMGQEQQVSEQRSVPGSEAPSHPEQEAGPRPASASWVAASCRASADNREASRGIPGASEDSPAASAGSLEDNREASADSPAASGNQEDSLPSPWGRSCAADNREAACIRAASADNPGASAAWHRDADKERHLAAREAAGWDQDS